MGLEAPVLQFPLGSQIVHCVAHTMLDHRSVVAEKKNTSARSCFTLSLTDSYKAGMAVLEK